MECKEVKQLSQIPRGADWQFEVKFDGYRCIVIKQRNETELFLRNGIPFYAISQPG
jgi:ATP-dependent DNA ligase